MKNRVAIDVRMWRHPGIGRYIRELTRALIREDNFFDLFFLGYLSDEAGIRHELRLEGPAASERYIRVRSRVYSAAEQIEMSRASRQFDLLHVPNFNVPYFCSCRLVTTIHDLTYLHERGAAKKYWQGSTRLFFFAGSRRERTRC